MVKYFQKIWGPKITGYHMTTRLGKIQRSKFMVTTWPNMVQNTVLEVMTDIEH